MWIRVALNDASVQYREPIGYSFVEGDSVEEFYFDDKIADALEKDGFLTEMWEKFNALFDWGDCDFFPAEKCVEFRVWLAKKISGELDMVIKPVYEVMLDYTEKAIKYKTGISFDF